MMGPNKNFILTLGVGMFCGFFAFYLLNCLKSFHPRFQEGFSLLGNAHSRKDLEDESVSDSAIQIRYHWNAHSAEERKEADRLFKEVRVLCWIMTNPNNHKKKARHVRATWARRCNKFLFVSSAEDKFLQIVALNVTEGRNYLWDKTKEAFKYIYKNHFNEADWFLKADDDTYVIVENLRYMLSPYNTNDPMYFGCRLMSDDYRKRSFMSGGAGYVLSKEGLKRFVEEAVPSWRKCQSGAEGKEDVEMGICLENVGVKAIDSRDHLGRGRFFPFEAQQHIIPGYIGPNYWFWRLIYYPSFLGMECCSDTAISFHYVPPKKMYELEYYLYQLRPYGINPKPIFPPPLPPDKSGITQRVLDKYKNDSEKDGI